LTSLARLASGLRARLRALWPDERGQRLALGGLFLLLLAGGLVRAGWMYATRPAIVGYPDENAYLSLANPTSPIWSDPTREVGYPYFLRDVHKLIEPLSGIVLLQHLFGLLAGVLLFLAIRRLRGPSWLALIPAAVVVLNGTEVMLEHMILTESLFIVLVAAGLYCAVRTAEDDSSWVWALATGLVFGVACTVRVVGVPLLAVLLPWLVFIKAPSLGRRLLRTGLAVAGVLAVLAPYANARHDATGYWGVGPPAGVWNLYARVAPFADCRKFDPPKGTERLCEKTPPAQRTTHPEEYNYAPSLSPADQLFNVNGSSSDPKVNSLLGSWTRQAIIHQPWDYLKTVTEGVAAYVVRTRLVFDNRDGLGTTFEDYYGTVIFDPQRTADTIAGPLSQQWGVPKLLIRQDWVDRLIRYEDTSRMKGPHVLVLMLLSLLAPFAPRGLPRRVGVLLFGIAWMSLIVPPATHFWDPRVAIVPLGPLAAAAAVGAWQPARWIAAWRS
jgi:hypothetical protein